MNNKDNNPNNEPQFSISEKFSEDLKNICRPAESVPPEVDRAVLDQAHQQLIRRYRPRHRFRWAASIAAAAAVVIFAFILNIARVPTTETAREAAQDTTRKYDLYTARKYAPAAVSSVIAEAQVDIDQNGRVDILDAFKLARHVESESTGHTEMKWDINGDGVVNSDDVDLVALSAVRLDKGVL